jgi:hypothetical protein
VQNLQVAVSKAASTIIIIVEYRSYSNYIVPRAHVKLLRPIIFEAAVSMFPIEKSLIQSASYMNLLVGQYREKMTA